MNEIDALLRIAKAVAELVVPVWAILVVLLIMFIFMKKE